MVRRSNSRRIIKEYLEQMPYTSHRLFDLIRGKIRRAPTFGQVKGICLSDTDIQYLAKNNKKNGRWGLRKIILERWEDGYINHTEMDYLSSKAFSEELNPERKCEFEFFKSLRDIINEEE